MADSLRDVSGDDDVREPLDLLVLDGLLHAHLGRLGLAVHGGKVALQHGHADAQA